MSRPMAYRFQRPATRDRIATNLSLPGAAGRSERTARPGRTG